jgi:ABC-2 type transport system ATP-binding protein
MIEVKNLVKKFGNAVAVDDITFEVKAGEVVGFLGPNGAGKSTTMKILTCFISATAGLASVGGFDCFRQPLEVRRQIGYLPEQTPLYNEMNVLDYLSFIADAHGMPSGKKRQRITEMVEICGLSRMVHKDIGELSKGFRQRVGLAQALVHNPDILILDEPTTGLDPNQIVEIRELIKSLGQDRAVILSTHILPEVEVTCSRILIISEGKLVGEGTPDELRHRMKGQEPYNLRVKGDKKRIESLFQTQDWIVSHEHTGTEPSGIHRFTISVTPPIAGEDAGEKLFDLAVGNSWKIIEMKKSGATLEQVFKNLTMREASLN